jgi:outer membrane protein assembly factor BamB
MLSKVVLGILFSVLFINVFVTVPNSSTTLSVRTRGGFSASATSQWSWNYTTFRLLAVERYFDDTAYKSAEYLIDELLKYQNWANASAYCVSYIHLLSEWDLSGDPKYGKFYKGEATKANMQSEIRNFFCQPVAGENTSESIRILYYLGHGDIGKLCLDEDYSYYDLHVDLISGPLGNNNCTVIILDTCHAGSAIISYNMTLYPVLEFLRRDGWVTLCACRIDEEANGWGAPQYWADFTGYKSTAYPNSTTLPLGIIGALNGGASDENNDFWLSAGEIFDFANSSTTDYASQEGATQDPVAFYGVTDGDVPIVPLLEPMGGSSCPGNGVGFYMSLSMTDRWDRYGHDASGTRASCFPGPLSNNSLYSRDFACPILSSLAVADGMAFVGTHGGTSDAMYALDMANSTTVWQYSLPAPVSSSPDVANGVVYFGTEAPNSTIYAIDEYIGEPRWLVPLGGGGGGGSGGVLSSPAVADNLVFVGTLDGYFYCLNATSGAPVWDYYYGVPIVSSPAVADGEVFFAAGSTLYAREEFHGGLLWASSLDGSAIVSSPAVVDGRVFIGTTGGGGGGGGLYALSETSGLPLWSDLGLGNVSSSPAVDSLNGLVIVGAGTNVECVRETSGTIVWTYSTAYPIGLSSPSVAGNGLVYVGSHGNGCVYCLNETTTLPSGQRVWVFFTGGPIDSSPAISGGHLFIGSADGKEYCLGLPWPDIGILDLWPSPTVAIKNNNVTIYCTLKNEGEEPETLVVDCFIDPVSDDPHVYEKPSKVILNETLTLKPGESITLNTTWDTSDATPQNLLWARLDPLTNEVNTTDNYLTFGLIYVIPSGSVGGGRMPYCD